MNQNSHRSSRDRQPRPAPRRFPLGPIAAALLLTLSVAARAQEHLPPTLPWSGASEALIAAPNDPWITPAERTGLTETPDYDQTMAYLRRLVRASSLLRLHTFGQTAEGRPLIAVVAAKQRAWTPDAARRRSRPVLLAQAGIHSGEIDGKDAGLMLLRDIALRGKDHLLDHVNWLFVPIFNADGHERASAWSRPNQRGPATQGWRTTAQNLNLNRDYAKADAPEMQAMLRLINDWTPALYLDLHVSDGMDHQYDITFTYNGDFNSYAWSPHIAGWLNNVYRPAVESALAAQGHIPGRFYDRTDEADLAQGFTIEPSSPRYQTGYGDLRHLPSVLVEAHSLKPYRQRVLGNYVLLESSLRALSAHGATLRQATDADRAARHPILRFNAGQPPGDRTEIDYRGVAYETFPSPISGRTEIRWLGTPKLYPRLPVVRLEPSLALKRPNAYWVPVSKPDVIQRLQAHGLRTETLREPRTVTLEFYRLIQPHARTNSGVHPFEGRYTLAAGVRPETRTEQFPAGSIRVPTDQPLGDLAIALLEPACEDSLFAWGFFLEVLQRTEYIEGYVLAPLGERMLADNPKLREEFSAKLQSDPAFAASTTARRRWFYERSPYYDQRHLLYPVGLER